ncbi:MAG TPA: 1-acyl-sn-glycerol-3-phosphate acyltransferase [Chitinophagales bacterium]|nr:1-acyl-sn-glycerol-3-phosphate acyltransferase [Chitinophagales bacterium]HMX05473.1 1-acyl-sn-glycerol-3-phosphate acyltransferase [Chitinophagales bacterium]HMZ89107.1 1-acyl-sn-glycerol-3-phosphate acyltransferase [Chitinophagales bacterium]HNE46458.1 1-acyl-sn-glycerol-3-phosphate acyltransferase [Chitinophagales bacterium]HNF68686.1 1-acyl-sn-glycerol-3-phosphate acyltransferase [Chitinophagales bacterium]
MASDNTNNATQRPYPRIIPDIDNWPIYTLSKDREQLIESVIDETLENILKKNPTEKDIHDELAKAVYLEKIRVERPWKTDAPDEKTFWNGVKNKLVQLESHPDNKIDEEKAILRTIIHRYVHEIVGNFNKGTYNFAERFVPFAFNRLLNASHSRAFTRLFGNKRDLLKSIHLIGEIEQVRELAKDGIIVAVPTHSSNIDSITVGWGISAIGLPAMFYGAGLNLFSVRFLAYFMNRLGAYRVDRRKKNAVYLEALKTYSTQVITKGGHSLFFPGGTRSRSNVVESQLKLGLLGTALEAQRRLILETNGQSFKKVYVVPVTMNYGFVLEAKELIDEHLKNVGKERYFVPSDKSSSSFKILKFMYRFFTADADFTIAFGKCMDIFGNPVDKQGNSLDHNGNMIDIRDYFRSHGQLTNDTQRDSVYTKMLSEAIVVAFKKNNVALPEHVIAFAAFKLFQKKHHTSDLYSVLRMAEEFRELTREELKQAVASIVKELSKLEHKEEIRVDPIVAAEDLDLLIDYAIKKLGVYHQKRPLLKTRKGTIKCQDMKLLLFYHNRLEGYGLEKHV